MLYRFALSAPIRADKHPANSDRSPILRRSCVREYLAARALAGPSLSVSLRARVMAPLVRAYSRGRFRARSVVPPRGAGAGNRQRVARAKPVARASSILGLFVSARSPGSRASSAARCFACAPVIVARLLCVGFPRFAPLSGRAARLVAARCGSRCALRPFCPVLLSYSYKPIRPFSFGLFTANF